LTAHPEYHAMFPTIANVPMGEMLNNPALKVSKHTTNNEINNKRRFIYIDHISLPSHQTLSVNVLTKLSELIDAMSNPDCLSGQLADLAKQHKNRGTTRAHFDVSISFFLFKCDKSH
jgi:hypothetical protein